MNADKLNRLKIRSEHKRRSRATLNTLLLLIAGITAAAVYYARLWEKEGERLLGGKPNSATAVPQPGAVAADTPSRKPEETSSMMPAPAGDATGAAVRAPTDSILTVSGYIVNRERIELSPRFLGVVKWIGVKKGDAVTNGQVVVLLDDAEYQAQLREAEARLENARVTQTKAELDYRRAKDLVASSVEMQKVLDDATLALESARVTVKEIESQLERIKIYLDWTIIRSPIDGVVLEKLVDPNELVTPQSFGGTRGPSTALISVADPQDLQVEIDLNETDVSKAFLNQRCRVSPEAYPDRVYEGYVAEIAPEANRQKGTLQVKVQVLDPDHYLTPELTARVDFTPQARADRPQDRLAR